MSSEKSSEFKAGDRVRFVRDSTADVAEFGTVGDTATVVGARRGDCVAVRLDVRRCSFDPEAFVADLELIEAPKTPAILAIKVPEQDIKDVLTTYVKDVLGIDASVAKIIQKFADAIELQLAR
ncbi:MAG: hypothetical protein ACTHJ3_00680 [Pararhizobium sp.]